MERLFMLVGALILASSCAHQAPRKEMDPGQKDRIQKILGQVCPRWCELQACWEKEPDVGICEIRFSFAVESSKREALKQIVRKAEKHQMKVVLCGDDTFATKMVAAFVGGAAAGAVAGATHSSLTSAGHSVAGANTAARACSDEDGK